MRGAHVLRRSRLAIAPPRARPRHEHERVHHDQPTGLGLPRRLEHQRAGPVPTRSRHGGVHRADAKPARATVEQSAKDAGTIKARQTEPLDVPTRCHERGDLAVGQERIFTDEREGGYELLAIPNFIELARYSCSRTGANAITFSHLFLPNRQSTILACLCNAWVASSIRNPSSAPVRFPTLFILT